MIIHLILVVILWRDLNRANNSSRHLCLPDGCNEVLLRARVPSLGGSPALQVPLVLHLGQASTKRQPPSRQVDNGCLR